MTTASNATGLTLNRPVVIRPGRPNLRTTFQLSAALIPDEGQAVNDLFTAARDACIKWVTDRFPEPISPEALGGGPFERDLHGQALQIVPMESEGVWTARLTHPDRDGVPGRVWSVELALLRQDDQVACGVRAFCASHQPTQAPIKLTRPGIVIELSKRFRMQIAAPVSGLAWEPQDEADLVRLRELLVDPRRQLPVYLLSAPDRKQLGISPATYLLDHQKLARKCQGIAHVVTMPWSLGYAWTEMVGKPWSAFLGAVRTYRPGLDFDEDNPSDHPRAFAERILGFYYNGQTMERAFEDFLIDKAYEHAATKRMEWGSLIFLADARTRAAALARESTTDEGEWRELYETEIKSLKEKVTELEGESEGYLDVATAAEQERDQAVEENRKLRTQIDSLRTALKAKTGEDPDTTIQMPASYDELAEWVETNLAGRLTLHNRAVSRGLKKPEFEDVEQVARVLLLLAGEYRTMRMGHDGGKDAFDRKVTEMSLRYDGSISEERAGQEGETYFVKWPYPTSSRRFLKWHIRSGGNTRDPKRCLAVYFCWDDDTQQVVVGWLPSHLNNRLT